MATYAELLDLSGNSVLQAKIRVACVIAAETIRTESPATANHANRLVWAASVFADPIQESRRMTWAVLAQNKDATVAQITGASDAVVQNAVNSAVDVFAV